MDFYAGIEIKEKILRKLLTDILAMERLKVDDFIGEFRFRCGEHTFVMDPGGEHLLIRKEFDYLEINMAESDVIFEYMLMIYRIVIQAASFRNYEEDLELFLKGLL